MQQRGNVNGAIYTLVNGMHLLAGLKVPKYCVPVRTWRYLFRVILEMQGKEPQSFEKTIKEWMMHTHFPCSELQVKEHVDWMILSTYVNQVFGFLYECLTREIDELVRAQEDLRDMKRRITDAQDFFEDKFSSRRVIAWPSTLGTKDREILKSGLDNTTNGYDNILEDMEKSVNERLRQRRVYETR